MNTLRDPALLFFVLGLAVVVPLLDLQWLKRVLPPFDALGLAATYGSVSAVTFVTASHVLESQGTPAGGHMAAALALMETPALMLAVGMAHRLRSSESVPVGGGTAALTAFSGPPIRPPLGAILHETLTDGGTVLLLGSLVVGMISGADGAAAMKPFSGDLFKGLLAFFLLDMGLLTARQVAGLRDLPKALFGYALLAPLVRAVLALVLARWAGLNVADATLLAVLAASASYIAVPAVLLHAVPEARPAVHVGLSLGLTFPFNLLIGIPVYQWMAAQLIA
jgi:hypothetical protein